MRQWTTSTSFSFGSGRGCVREWQVIVPDLADDYPFLMHGVLASSALHLAVLAMSDTEKRRWRALSLQHLDRGLDGYMPLLSTMDEMNCHALFAFSSILAAFTSASHQFPFEMYAGAPPSQELVELCDTFGVLKGIVVILEKAMQWVEQGPLRAIVSTPSLPGVLGITTGAEFARLLPDLRAVNIRLSNSSDVHTCSAAIDRLNEVFQPPPRDLGMMGLVLQWPMRMPTAFVPLMRQRHPVALLLTAFWGVALQQLNDAWCFRGWGRHIVEIIQAALMGQLEELMQWPCKRTGVAVASGDEQDQ